MVLGVISQKSNKISVTTPVLISSPYSSGRFKLLARVRVVTVARADAPTFTRLFPIRIVIKSESESFLIISSDFEPQRFSRTRDCTVCLDSVMSAISEPEKKAEAAIRIINNIHENGSIFEKSALTIWKNAHLANFHDET